MPKYLICLYSNNPMRLRNVNSIYNATHLDRIYDISGREYWIRVEDDSATVHKFHSAMWKPVKHRHAYIYARYVADAICRED